MRGDGRAAPKGSQPQSPSSPQHSLSNGSSNGKSSPTMAKFTNGNGVRSDSNGTSGAGHKHSNGVSGPKDLPAVWQGHSRAEVTRILVQSLNEMGYHNAARTLSMESGFQVETSLVSSFRNCVLGGDWLQTENILFGDRSRNGSMKWSGASQGLPLVESADRNDMLFSIRQQKYLELLERRDLSNALVVLRQELTPLHQDSDRLHALGALLMCPSAEDLRAQANWDGNTGKSRRLLLQELSKSISPTIMIPEHRLANLFDQVKQSWVDDCMYHNTNDDPSLYVDHTCDRSDFPCYPDITLNDHNDGEAWYVAFSNRGKFLATAGSDKTVHVYEIQETGFKHFTKFRMHQSGVCFLAWSPDDTKLISCTRESDKRLRVLDINNPNEAMCEISGFSAPTTAACWLPDGETFVLSTLDLTYSIGTYSTIDSQAVSNGFRESNLRVYDLALSPDMTRLVALTEQQIIVYDFNSKHRIGEYPVMDPFSILDSSGLGTPHVSRDGQQIQTRHNRHGSSGVVSMRDSNGNTIATSRSQKPSMTSLSISADSKYMLISQNPSWIRMLHIDTGEEVRAFEGHIQKHFMIRSSWGGAHESFVVSGSEDNNIYIWRASTGQLIDRLEGHDGCVNCVSWNPVIPGIFASASDDGTVKVWYSKKTSDARKSASQGLPPRELVYGERGSSMIGIGIHGEDVA